MFLCLLIFEASLCLFLCMSILGRTAMSAILSTVALCSRCSVESCGTASLFTWAMHSRSIPSYSHVGCVYPTVVVKPWLLLARQWEGFNPRLTGGCKDWLASTNHHGGSAVQGPTPQSRTYFSRALELTESTPWMSCLSRQLGGASMWTQAVHQLHWLWGLPEHAGQGQLPPVFYWGHPAWITK